MKKLVIFGAGDFARLARVYFSKDADYEVSAFTVDDQYLKQDRLLELPVTPFSSLEDKYPPNRYALFVAVGFKRMNKARGDIYERAKARGYELATYISSRISHCGEWSCGDNCFILEQNVIQPFVRIGNNVVLWSGNHIGHDVSIDDHCFISSHVVLSGNVQVGRRSFLGVNACVRQGVTIAEDCLIGAGAVILKNTRPGGVYLVKSTQASPVSSSEVEDLL